ncbi:MAG: precorrin-2 C(20)-methyltransferase [Alphaproteobacteria bacterium]|nr:precorrin-2 C(20)-methyltransferase [Alphaproteobacteria bacterium]
MITGRLIGVGVGPGDPELITVKAIKAIRSVPVVAYISANGRPSLARQIAAEHIGGSSKEIKVTLPMHPSPEVAQSAYDEGASRISAELEQGKDTAVLCEGDPLFYGSFGHLLGRLHGRYPAEIVPGVSSVMAAAAAAEQPLAFGAEGISVLPATMPENVLSARLETADTAVILKLGRHIEKVRTVLETLGLVDRAIYIERASTSGEKLVPLAELDSVETPYFSLILVTRQRR